MKTDYEGCFAAIGLGVLGIGMIAVFAILGTLFGAIGGWIVGLFFGTTILKVGALYGLHGVTMWELGATLGFVGSFFKSSVAAKGK